MITRHIQLSNAPILIYGDMQMKSIPDPDIVVLYAEMALWYAALSGVFVVKFVLTTVPHSYQN